VGTGTNKFSVSNDLVEFRNEETLLMAAPLAVLAPCETAEAMKSTFAAVAHESLARGERARWRDGRINCGV
jgi:hypothetical protein